MRKIQKLVMTLFAGVLLTITAPLANAQLTFNLLHTFTNVPDGDFPQGVLIQDANGNLYGTTAYGGNGGPNCSAFGVVGGCGTVFKIDKNGNYTQLYAFLGGNDGAAPRAGLAMDAKGNLYGTTQGQGTVEPQAPSTLFKVDPSGHETVLKILTNNKSGGSANTAPVLDAVGNIYGTTPFGGSAGYGVIYEYGAHGGFSIVHAFTDVTDGEQPYGGLVIDASGNLYGATTNGGDGLTDRWCYTDYTSVFESGCGTIFKITPSGEFSVLYRFQGRADGGNPVSVVLDPDGNLYGITDSRGNTNCYPPHGCGTIFKIDTRGKFSVLYTLNPDHPADIAYDNLFRDASGNLYSLNQIVPTGNGYLFELDTNGNYTLLYTFGTPSTGGVGPFGAMIAPNGTFYGTLLTGGALGCGSPGQNFGCGTVFQLIP